MSKHSSAALLQEALIQHPALPSNTFLTSHSQLAAATLVDPYSVRHMCNYFHSSPSNQGNSMVFSQQHGTDRRVIAHTQAEKG